MRRDACGYDEGYKSVCSKTFFIDILVAPTFAAVLYVVSKLVVVAADVLLFQVVYAQLKGVLLVRLRLMLHAPLLEVPELLRYVSLLVQQLALLLYYLLQLHYLLQLLVEVLHLVQPLVLLDLLLDLPAKLLPTY